VTDLSERHVDRAESRRMMREVFPPEDYGYNLLDNIEKTNEKQSNYYEQVNELLTKYASQDNFQYELQLKQMQEELEREKREYELLKQREIEQQEMQLKVKNQRKARAAEKKREEELQKQKDDTERAKIQEERKKRIDYLQSKTEERKKKIQAKKRKEGNAPYY